MTLGDILNRIDQLKEDDVIFAEKPWSLDSRAMVGALDKDFRVPSSILNMGLSYFMERSTILEVLGVFGERKPTDNEKRELILFYAENDAYPDWVYGA